MTARGSFDWDALSGWADLGEYFEPLDLSGWKRDVAALDNFLKSEQPEPIDAEPQIDRAEELRVKWGVELGQMWQLGEHRLICGDCTDPAVVVRVMGGERADLCLTDPPYATGGISDGYDIDPKDLQELINNFLPIAQQVSKRQLLTPGNAHQFIYPKPTWVLAWFVSAGTGANPWGFTFWNAVFAYGKDPYLEKGLGSRPDAFVKTEAAEKVSHPTSKPVGVWSWLVERGTTEKGQVVFDPFSGSGTTIIACENLGRKCRAVELSPGYVSVALERWATATGKTPTLITD